MGEEVERLLRQLDATQWWVAEKIVWLELAMIARHPRYQADESRKVVKMLLLEHKRRG